MLHLRAPGERSMACVGDHHPDNLQRASTGAYGPRLFGCQAVADENREQLGLEAVGKHARFGTAVRTAGEYPKCPALVVADARARSHRHCTIPRFKPGGWGIGPPGAAITTTQTQRPIS